MRQSRFAPAQTPVGRAVAVNMVWLIVRTTVQDRRSRATVRVPPSVAPVTAGPAGRSRSKTPPLKRVRSARDVNDGLTPARRRFAPRARHVVQRIGRAQDHAARAGISLQHQLELLEPRVGDAVLRIDRLPAVAVERVVGLLHRRVRVAHLEGDRQRARRRGGPTVTVIAGGVLSMSNDVLSIAPVSAVAGEFDGASDATTRTK